MEGTAFASELIVLMRRDDVTPQEMLGCLIEWIKRLARVIIEIDIHVNTMEPEAAAQKYANMSGMTLDAAKADLVRVYNGVMNFSSYAVGFWGVEALAKKMDVNFEQAFAMMMKQGAGFVSPHLLAHANGVIDRPEELDFLADANDVLLPVAVSQAKFSKAA
ncbi:MAG: hypothetical protein HYV33_02615 [Candidatus Kerfeldbacteria bacterium]|nr:hypothetical protein [Candidatus Kerfeldbacteria bacterium]